MSGERIVYWVRSRVSGRCPNIDTYDFRGDKTGEKVVVRVAEQVGQWCIDSRPVAVENGLCVSFVNMGDAQYFVDQGRAEYIAIEPGTPLAFELESDANWFVRKGLADLMSKAEVTEMFAVAQAQYEAAQRANEPEEKPAAPAQQKRAAGGKRGK